MDRLLQQKDADEQRNGDGAGAGDGGDQAHGTGRHRRVQGRNTNRSTDPRGSPDRQRARARQTWPQHDEQHGKQQRADELPQGRDRETARATARHPADEVANPE